MIEGYVATLDRRLRGVGELKTELLTEVRHGLGDAAEAYRAAGVPAGEAERRAVSEFGSVDELAPDLQRELGLAQGRRTARLFALTMPLCVTLSTMGWAYLHPPSAVGARWPLPAAYGVASTAVDLTAYGSAVLALFAWMLLGPAARFMRTPDWAARAVARGAVATFVTSLLSGLALTAVSAWYAPAAVLSWSMALSMLVWTAFFVLAYRSTRACLATVHP